MQRLSARLAAALGLLALLAAAAAAKQSGKGPVQLSSSAIMFYDCGGRG